ncbi:MAG: SDR family oxidoreductase [Myxococcota bacterium]
MTTQALAGKHCVVSGVTSGIGRASVERLIAEQAFVVGLARDSERLAQMQTELGPRFRPLNVDLAIVAQVLELSAALQKLAPRVDVFISNAAECAYVSPLEAQPADLERWFQVNVLSPIALCRAIAPLMPAGAQIVQLSSVTARWFANAKFGPYAATKAAAETLFEALRLELHPRDIHVSVLAPGLVATPIYDKVPNFSRARAKLESEIPTWLSAGDVADAIIWMLSRPAHVVVSELVMMPSKQTR